MAAWRDMAPKKKATVKKGGPVTAPTADAICEAIAYMQRERHLIKYLVRRMDSFDAELRRITKERSYHREWARLERKIENLREDFRRAQGTFKPRTS